MAGASGTIFDWSYFAPERPAFQAIATWSSGTLTVGLVLVAMLVFVAAFAFGPIEKAALLAWLLLP